MREYELYGSNVSIAPAVVVALLSLFALALLAIAAAELLAGAAVSHTGPSVFSGISRIRDATLAHGPLHVPTPGQTVNQSQSTAAGSGAYGRGPTTGAAAELAGMIGVNKWKRLERLTCYAALLQIADTQDKMILSTSTVDQMLLGTCCICLEDLVDQGGIDRAAYGSECASLFSRTCDVAHVHAETGGHSWSSAHVRLRCEHVFHRRCILRLLLKSSNRCPLCCAEIISKEDCAALDTILSQCYSAETAPCASLLPTSVPCPPQRIAAAGCSLGLPVDALAAAELRDSDRTLQCSRSTVEEAMLSTAASTECSPTADQALL